ncbi:molybdenum cofactor sulfurase [Ostrinia furnacalis]|uniref:molybdenum cofactor sulfurase n=1 Tax=Ostrinia furnacalis TaxID=93504 RepID=UPI0010399201|nr:molybdenum cofactor sulfurase [Ostrinia furnacalis]XP_028170454.1 molybdenum cofactor sulfurase [Ostrinia furnacalis]
MTTLSKVIENDRMQNILSEFSRLGDRCYLENAGASLYPQSLPLRVNQDLMKNVYMNPHTDKDTKDCIEQIRSSILRHFNTDSSNYSVIFTSGTTQALKLVVESFQFAFDQNEVLNCGSFVYLRDNHTSVLGLRELATEKNADIIHICHDDFLKALNPTEVTPSNSRKESYKNDGNTLLVYPAQSNFNGFKYPINCIQNIKDGCLNSYIKKHLCKVNCNWYVLLDAASYISTNKLDLSVNQPDFVCLSFYKIFGYPTGLGALLVKNTSINVLNEKKYFGGGTVDIVLSSEDYHVKKKVLHERFEDGTLPFLSIIALKHCFDTLNELIPRVISEDFMDTISYHTFYLAKDLYKQLNQLEHRNGNKAAIFYMDSDFTDIKKQGGIVTFSLMREDGSHIGYSEFQHMADLFNISVRTGCFCNSGSCQRHLNATNKEMKDMYKAGHKCGDEIDLVNGRPTGAIRVSFGYYNTFKDVDKLILMICRCFVKTKLKKPSRTMKHYKIGESKQKKCNEESMRLLSDDYYKKIAIIQEPSPFESEVSLKEIAIFPIKSCGAFKVNSSWKIGPKGFEYDREWMIVKDNGVCLTQKQNTRMCMIRPTIDLHNRWLILECKGMPTISVSLDQTANKQKNAMFCQSKVCTDIVCGYDCGDEVADWISNALEVSFLRLIRQSNDDVRVQKKKGEGDKNLLSLSNQAQYLLINKATVRWLSDKIQDPSFQDSVEELTDRFRGNIVIDTDQELAERDWHRVIIGKHEFKVDGQCSRCQMVCIDQKTGEKTVEPLRTISEQFGGKLRFGIYLSYIGPVDGSRDRLLKLNSPVKPIINDDDISR